MELRKFICACSLGVSDVVSASEQASQRVLSTKEKITKVAAARIKKFMISVCLPACPPARLVQRDVRLYVQESPSRTACDVDPTVVETAKTDHGHDNHIGRASDDSKRMSRWLKIFAGNLHDPFKIVTRGGRRWSRTRSTHSLARGVWRISFRRICSKRFSNCKSTSVSTLTASRLTCKT